MWFLPKVGTFVSSPHLTRLNTLGQVPYCLFPTLFLSCCPTRGQTRWHWVPDLPVLSFSRLRWKSFSLLAGFVKGGAFLRSWMTLLTPRALAMFSSGVLTDVCWVTHMHSQSPLWLSCMFSGGLAGPVVQPVGQPEPSIAWMGNEPWPCCCGWGASIHGANPSGLLKRSPSLSSGVLAVSVA